MRTARLYAAMLLVGILACASKGELDDKVTALTDALSAGDRAGFDALMAPGMVKDFSPEKFQRLGAALKSLGPVQERTMKSISVNNGVAEGTYTLAFADGEVGLHVTLTPDRKISAFLYDGEVLNAAAASAAAAQYAEFKVYDFVFLADENNKNPNGNRYALGSKAAFGIVVGGLGEQDGKRHVVADLVLKDGGGKVVHDKKGFIDTSMDAGPVPTARLFAWLEPPAAGTFQLQFTFRDVAAGKETTYGQMIEVTGGAAAPGGKKPPKKGGKKAPKRKKG